MSVLVRSKELKMVPLSEIKLNPKNRNTHPKEQIAELVHIIQTTGFRRPVTISNQSGFLSCGEGRFLAAKKLKMKEIPAIFQDYDSPDQEYADGVADNAIDKWAALDLSSINNDILDMGPDFDIRLMGIKDFVIEPAEKFEAQCDEDSIPDKVEPKTKLGDLYILGKHRLLCGDSTSITDVDKLIEGQSIDMIFTDPPYGMNLDTDYSTMGKSSKTHKPVKGDNDDFTPDLINTIFASAPNAREVFVWGADYYADLLPNRNDGSWIVWDKRSSEDDIGKMDGQFGSSFELCWSKNKHKREIARFTRPTSFYRPTQKPVVLIEWFFNNWGKDKDVVLDLYGGSGSTIIACEKMNRSANVMEFEPRYCDVIVARWEKYTGQTAKLIPSGGEDGTSET